MPWSTRFPEPIHGLETLRQAASYIQKLPKAEQAKTHWQDAVEHLIKAAEGSPGWMMFAEMFMLKALHHGRPEPEKEPRRKTVKVYRVVS
jgi:hypothetical protein